MKQATYDDGCSSSKLLRHTHPFPTPSDLGDRTVYIPGGIRVGARYPDIIINKQDVERAKLFMAHYDVHSIDDICHLVDKIFKTKNVVHIEKVLESFPPWGESTRYNISPFYKAEKCFDRKVFQCSKRGVCTTRRRNEPNTLTNIMALPYMFGDCREIAWFTGFLCHIANVNISTSYRICYSTLYTILADKKKIHKLFDHVFVLAINGDIMTVVDPSNMRRAPNIILLHGTVVKHVKRSELRDYKSESDVHERIKRAPIFECGKIFVNGKQQDRLIAVPKIYHGGMRWINTSSLLQTPEEDVLLWNSPIPYSLERTWHYHKEWC